MQAATMVVDLFTEEAAAATEAEAMAVDHLEECIGVEEVPPFEVVLLLLVVAFEVDTAEADPSPEEK
jgi:hypothetical protein